MMPMRQSSLEAETNIPLERVHIRPSGTIIFEIVPVMALSSVQARMGLRNTTR